jgi:hypothetical protein
VLSILKKNAWITCLDDAPFFVPADLAPSRTLIVAPRLGDHRADLIPAAAHQPVHNVVVKARVGLSGAAVIWISKK